MSLIRSFIVVSGNTLGSRVLGFIRDIIMASLLGTSFAADAFFVAFKIPNLFRRLFAEGAFNVAFVPILTRLHEDKGQRVAEKFSSVSFTLLLLILVILTILVEIFMPALITVVSPGFINNPEKFNLTVELARITFPYLPLITFVSFASGILNTRKHFGAAAFAPTLLNVAFISCMLLLPEYGISAEKAASIAVPAGGVLQVILLAYSLKKLGFKLNLSWPPTHEYLPKLFRRLGPAALGVGVLQLSTLIDIFLASLLASGSISYLFYADRLNQLPLALIGIALGTVLLPHLSRQLKSDRDGANSTFNNAFTAGTSLSLAATIGLVLLAPEIMNTLFERGAFNKTSSLMSAQALMAYALGLPAIVILKITTTTFYANEDTKSPFRFALIALSANLILNLILMQFMAHVGLALATALSSWLNAFLQLYSLRKHRVISFNTGAISLLGKLLGVAFFLVVTLYAYKNFTPFPETTLLKSCWLAGAILLALAIFSASVHGTGLYNLKSLRKLFSRNAG